MNCTIEELRAKLINKNLKVTPQRIAILEAVCSQNTHPTADNIIEYIRRVHPNIATGTVYKVLEALVEVNLIKKVKTEKDIMRYDAVIDNHHHLYCVESERIEDYMDTELDELLEDYFRKKGIEGFSIEDITLQIKGNFLNH
jgi:Fur family peroxide stress response transcriptional regulator